MTFRTIQLGLLWSTFLLCFLAGCGGASNPSSHSSKSAAEAEAIARTEFTSKLENFFEYDPMAPGRSSRFLIHLTELATGEPVRGAKVELKVETADGKRVAQSTAKIGRVDGIYVAELTVPESGRYRLLFQVDNERLQDTMSLEDFGVGIEPESEEGDEGASVAFLMEQQWLISMTLAQAKAESVSVQIPGVGKVVAAPNSMAVVSSPVAGLLRSGDLPAVGRQLHSEQALVQIEQTLSASESAQVRAALAQVRAAELQTRVQLEMQAIELERANAQSRNDNARLQVEKAEAGAAVARSRTRLELAEREQARAKQVFQISGISQKEFQASESALREAQVAYRESLKREGALKKTRPVPLWDRAQTPASALRSGLPSAPEMYTLRAPFSGVVTKVHKRLGEQIQPGEPVLELANLRSVWLEVPLFEKDLNTVKPTTEIRFRVPSYPDRELRGSLVDLGRVIDPQERTASAFFRVDNQDLELILGQQVEAVLESVQESEVLMVPREAVLEREGKRIVFVLLDGEHFQRREVTVGGDYGDSLAITSGLEANDWVVAQGSYQVLLQELAPADPGVHSHEV